PTGAGATRWKGTEGPGGVPEGAARRVRRSLIVPRFRPQFTGGGGEPQRAWGGPGLGHPPVAASHTRSAGAPSARAGPDGSRDDGAPGLADRPRPTTTLRRRARGRPALHSRVAGPPVRRGGGRAPGPDVATSRHTIPINAVAAPGTA